VLQPGAPLQPEGPRDSAAVGSLWVEGASPAEGPSHRRAGRLDGGGRASVKLIRRRWSGTEWGSPIGGAACNEWPEEGPIFVAFGGHFVCCWLQVRRRPTAHRRGPVMSH